MQKIRKITSILCALSILIGMMVIAPTALAVGEPQWVEKAPMVSARSNVTCEVVSGKVYLFGGNNSTDPVLSAVGIYDPETNTWTEGKPMPTSRYGATSGEVNGKICVIGGVFGGSSAPKTDKVEIYNPKTNTWTEGKPMPTARCFATSEVLDGKVYVIGGAITYRTDKVEIYNPETNTWTEGKPMPTARQYAASGVVNGKIYVIGGDNTSKVEIYNPETNTWTEGAPMPTGAFGAASVTVGNKIYIISGNTATGRTTAVYIYDTINNSWSVGPALLNTHECGCAAFVNNSIYAIGGYGKHTDFKGVEALEVSPIVAERKLAVLLNTGETAQLSVSYDLADNASLTWSSSNQSVATVDANGKVTAIGKGECDITAQNADGTWKQSIPVRVLPGTADLFRLAVHLKPAQNAKLHLTDNPADTTWKSLDTAVATVDAAGKVTAVSQGLAIMEATNNGQTHQIYVRVKA